MRVNFADCLAQVLRHEGGYVDHPRDPGGATNRGITIGTLAAWRRAKGQRRPTTKRDVRDLTVIEAGEIYRANYWDKCHCDLLPSGVDSVVMDGAVNSGPGRSVRWLQQALGVAVDGRVGPVTIRAARDARAEALIRRVIAIRLGFLKRLKTWGTFGRGWSRRLRGVEAHALGLARRSPVADGVAAAAGATAGAGAAVNERVVPVGPDAPVETPAIPAGPPADVPEVFSIAGPVIWAVLAAVVVWFAWSRRAQIADLLDRAIDRIRWAKDAWSISAFEGDFIGLYREFRKAAFKTGREKADV